MADAAGQPDLELGQLRRQRLMPARAKRLIAFQTVASAVDSGKIIPDAQKMRITQRAGFGEQTAVGHGGQRLQGVGGIFVQAQLEEQHLTVAGVIDPFREPGPRRPRAEPDFGGGGAA
ncbi:MAG: hypothetical protein IPM75_11020 [Candidatus Competibacteraceae bacterium]|nr:hypothetical protein [Candidatus Competibacteraceae bacterium]